MASFINIKELDDHLACRAAAVDQTRALPSSTHILYRAMLPLDADNNLLNTHADDQLLHPHELTASSEAKGGSSSSSTIAGRLKLRPCMQQLIPVQDVRHHLNKHQRQLLLHHAFATTDQDNEILLHRIKHRIDRVGIKLPTVEVRFENLSVHAEVHTGSRALPTLVNFVQDIVESCLAAVNAVPSKKQDLAILRHVSGVIKPGRMALLLGPPGAGKSTLLLALAGKLGSELRTQGTVTFNGNTFSEFIPQRTCSYVSQDDTHIAELTVRETLDFAARCQGVGFKHDILVELARREQEQNIHPDPQIDAFMKAMAVEGEKHSLSTDCILKVLGLEICADTIVGNDMIRGISGGQKKRLTTGEMVVGPKKTFFMDEISTGLDSSTTYQIVKCVRNFVHLLQGTVLMALLQPAPEVFELFDDIILLSEGHIVYLGPQDRVLDFFESIGFKLTSRKGIADFLQEVTSRKDQEQYWADKNKPYQFMPVSAIAQAFANFEVGMELQKTLGTPFNKLDSHPAALVKKRYALPTWDLMKACFEREVLLISRNRYLYTFKTCQICFVACITATLFLHTRLSPSDEVNGFLYLSALFFSLMHMTYNGLSEMTFTVTRLPVLYKQRDNLFYPSWAISVPSWISRIPYSCVESIIWSSIVYYSIGFAPEAARFFKYIFLLFLLHQIGVGLFRLIGAMGRSMVVAQTFGSFALLIVFSLGGFLLSDNIHPWWVWAFWISPLSYAQNAIAVNEFLAPRWKKLSSTGRQLYLTVLDPKGLQTEGYWYWIAIGALIGYTFVFNLMVTLALGYLNPLERSQAVFSEGTLDDSKSQEKNSKKSANKLQQIQKRSMARLTSMQASRTVVQGGMTLPFQTLSLTFHNICYYVDMPAEMRIGSAKGERLQLLRNVSGAFRPGVLTALVGVSGAGKTTLMDVLAGRKTGGYIEGDIRVSGFPKRQETFARVAGYVEQTDIHSPQLTVEESLTFSSWLRLPTKTASTQRQAFVEEVMKLVELNTIQNALVGLPGTTGLSTEQRKRLTIAVELVANPSIIFMDEPTSGLDARAAAIVMRTVRNTVNTGRTVVCTIHQPSIDIFEAFDELLLMKSGGQIIYDGPLGKNSSLMIQYFQDIKGLVPIKDGQNPATWMLEISTPYAEEKIGKDLAEIYLNSHLYKKKEALIQELSAPVIGQKDLEFSTTYSQDSWTQLLACLWKQQITYWRSPEYNVVRFFFTTVCAILFGTIFWNLGSKRKTQQDIANIMGGLYASVIFLGVINASSVQPVVAVERSVFYRERAAAMYHTLSYAVAQGLIEIPYILVQTLLYGTITYSMINFEWTPGKFSYYMLFMFLTFTYFTFYGMMVIGLSPTQHMAAVVSTTFFSVWNLFSGFLIPRPRMPPWWSWYYYICPVAWTLHGLIGSQLGDVNTVITVSGGQRITVAQFIHMTYGFGHDHLYVCVAVLLTFAISFWLIFAVALKFINHQRR